MSPKKITIILYTVLATFIVQGVFLVVYSFNEARHNEEDFIQDNQIKSMQAKLKELNL